MLVYGENFENDPEYQAGMVEFWCNCTGTNSGPDSEEAKIDQCRDPERSCYKEY